MLAVMLTVTCTPSRKQQRMPAVKLIDLATVCVDRLCGPFMRTACAACGARLFSAVALAY